MPPPHEPLDREDSILGVGHLLMLGDLPDEPLSLVGETHHRRGQARAGGIHQNLRR